MISSPDDSDPIDYSILVSNTSLLGQYASASIDPYKKYWDKFSYFTDLKRHSEASLGATATTDKELKGLFSKIRKISSCGKGGKMNLFYSTNFSGGISGDKVGTSILGFPETKGNLVDIKLALHEMGHGYAGLNDEYTYPDYLIADLIKSDFALSKFMGRNCAALATASADYSSIFSYGGKSYASPKLGCSINSLFRPSEKSLMNNHNDDTHNKFNVVSCGYIIAAIKGGNPKSYWSECAGLDTVPITQ
jgi:hypothetical protein